MQHPNKVRGGWPRPGALLGLLLAVLLLAACKKTTGIADDLPAPADANRLAFYTDTITVRTSTVFVDSIPSSTSSYLLTGRYVDPLLGTIGARSYATFNLDAELVPDPTQVYDSLVLVLTPDAYRYGDTTRVQQLEVHQVVSTLRTVKSYYTKDDVAYSANVLGSRSFRATKQLKPLRIKLSNTLGQRLWSVSQTGQLTTQEQFMALLPGLAVLPGAGENAAMLRWASKPVISLYHHSQNDPGTALAYTFTAGLLPHFFHLAADRTGTALAALTKPGQAISSTATGNRSFVEAGLGLYTKLEFPYLTSFKQFGNTLVLNSATLQLVVPATTESKLLALPTSIVPQLVDLVNRPSTPFTTLVMQPKRVTLTRTNLEQDTYTLDLATYVQGVLAGTYNNYGLILNPNASEATVNRAALGNSADPIAPLQVKMYYTRIVQ